MRRPPRRPLVWPKVVPTRPTACIRAARVFGRCVALAEQDPALSAARRNELAQSYADQAVGNLREAVRRGFTNVGPLKTSGAFAPLRGRPDFQQLIHELARR